METFIENENLKLKISTFGAEIQQIINKKNKKNYLWNGDKAFWGRRAPVLFPVVGALKNKEYIYNNEKYSMGQHGFSRDMEFELIEKTNSTAIYELNSSEETLKKYPFKFSLKIKYELLKNTIKVNWKVENIDNKKMYFSIGAHPAFLVPIEKREECFVKFDSENELEMTQLKNGLANEKSKIITENGYLKLEKDLFENDAIIFENNQVKEVSLCTPDKEEFVAVRFSSPLVGIWSPYKENCPFVCIEPWYGRCDSIDFEGDLTKRQWQQNLLPNEKFEASYEIVID